MKFYYIWCDIKLYTFFYIMDIDKYWTKRQTVRRFSEKDIPDDLLYSLLEKASYAPTTGNMQLYSVVVTKDSENKKQLAAFHYNQPASVSAQVLLTFCADFNRFIKWCEVNNAEPGFDNFQSFISAMLDATIFAQQFNTIAEMNGLGCCYLGTTTYNAHLIAKQLELPKFVIPVVTLAVGYPVEETCSVGRLPIRPIVHVEKYSDYSPVDIQKCYIEKESREDSKRFVAENKKDNLAQVFTDVRYPKSQNEEFSKYFIDFIKNQGFKL